MWKRFDGSLCVRRAPSSSPFLLATPFHTKKPPAATTSAAAVAPFHFERGLSETSSGASNDSDAGRERRTEPVPVPVPVPVRVTGGIVAEREPTRRLELVTWELALTESRGDGAPPSTGKRSCR